MKGTRPTYIPCYALCVVEELFAGCYGARIKWSLPFDLQDFRRPREAEGGDPNLPRPQPPRLLRDGNIAATEREKEKARRVCVMADAVFRPKVRPSVQIAAVPHCHVLGSAYLIFTSEEFSCSVQLFGMDKCGTISLSNMYQMSSSCASRSSVGDVPCSPLSEYLTLTNLPKNFVPQSRGWKVQRGLFPLQMPAPQEIHLEASSNAIKKVEKLRLTFTKPQWEKWLLSTNSAAWF